MPLKQLIAHFSQTKEFPIHINDIRNWIINSGYQDEIEFYPVDSDKKILKGQIVQYEDNICGAYNQDGPKRVSRIIYSKHLNTCGERFVCCKEMLHILDPQTCKTSTKEEIDNLTFNLTSPSDSNESEDTLADRRAVISTLRVLAPMPIVKQIQPMYKSGARSAHSVALFLRIPEFYVPFLMSDNYQRIVKD